MLWNYVTIGSGLFGVLGVVLAIYFYFAGKKEKAPVYTYKSVNLIGLRPELPEDIQILHKGVSVPRVCRTKILFWNRGRATIDGNDIVERVTIKFPQDVRILREPVVETVSRDPIRFVASFSGNVIYLDFAFLDKDDGALIEVLHTGDDESKMEVEGTIKGARQGVKYSEVVTRIRRRDYVGASLLSLLAAVALLLAFIYIEPPATFRALVISIVILGGYAAWAVFFLYSYFTAKRPPSFADALY